MLKKLRSGACAVLVCVLACAAPAYAAPAEPAVVYDGAAKAWHGENLQEQDVIATVADVMPGDALVQEFHLVVRHVERGVTLSMRPDASGAALDALGDMAIEVRDGADALVARGTLAELASAEGAPLDLGAYTADSARSLRITMTVPTSVGNESQGVEHAIAWIFTAQEDGGSVSAGSDDLLVQTGDNLLNVYGPFALSVLGLLLIAAAVVAKRRK
ncbi:MAG: hypothetical protein ACLTSX_04895 [Collinsella sp.]